MFGIDAMLEGTVVGRIDTAPRQNGALSVLNFSVQVQTKDPREEMFCRVGMCGDQAKALAEMVETGAMVQVRGKMALKHWMGKNGEPRSGLAVQASEIKVMGEPESSWGNIQGQHF